MPCPSFLSFPSATSSSHTPAGWPGGGVMPPIRDVLLPWLRPDSSSRRISLSRFLNALYACFRSSSVAISRSPGNLNDLHSDQNPDLVLPDLHRKPVHPRPPHRGTTTVIELEPPLVQGADDFALLDPALAQRATGMRAGVRQSDNRLSGEEDRDAQAEDLAGSTAARGNLIVAASQDPIGHDTWHSRRQPGWKTASLGLASEAATTGRFYGTDRLSPNVLGFLILGTNAELRLRMCVGSSTSNPSAMAAALSSWSAEMNVSRLKPVVERAWCRSVVAASCTAS